MQRLVVGSILSVISLLVIGCSSQETAKPAVDGKALAATVEPKAKTVGGAIDLTPAAVQTQGIEVAMISRRSAMEQRIFPASVEAAANRSASISVPIPSRIQGVLVDLGTRVSQGQTVLALTSSELGSAKAEFLAAKANMLASKTQVITARQLVKREKFLVGRGISALQEQQRAEAQLASAEAALAGTEASMEASEAQLLALGLTESEISSLKRGQNISPALAARSPISGQVIQRNVRVGQVVQPGEPLLTVANLDEVWIILKVFQSDIGRLRVGDQVKFTLRDLAAQTISGRVLLISETLDPETRTADVRVVVPNGNRQLKPGMLLQAQVQLNANSAAQLAVPERAVYDVEGQPTVFVRETATRFRPQKVKLGAKNGAYIEVVSGLKTGDPVVVEGGFLLKSEMLKS